MNDHRKIAAPKEYRAKIFKSGNSVALRLPKALGLTEGMEMIVREDQGSFTAMPVDATPKKIDISGFAGKLPGFKPAPREDFEDSPRVWDDPDWPGWVQTEK